MCIRDSHGIKRLIRDIGAVYRDTPALWSRDFEPSGFSWVVGDDAAGNVLAYERYADDGSALLAIVNLSGSTYRDYRMHPTRQGAWELLLNTDDAVYQGAGNDLPHEVTVDDDGAIFYIPANSVQWYRYCG